MTSKNPNQGEGSTPPAGDSPARFIDEIIAYIRSRQESELRNATQDGPVDEDHLIRAALRHLRRHPLPTALLGVSVAWLLFAYEQEDEELSPEIDPRVEDEIIQQVKGGYAYTNQHLRALVDRYPWAAATAIVGGGILAALLLPQRPKSSAPDYVGPDPMEDERTPGEDYGFDSPADDER